MTCLSCSAMLMIWSSDKRSKPCFNLALNLFFEDWFELLGVPLGEPSGVIMGDTFLEGTFIGRVLSLFGGRDIDLSLIISFKGSEERFNVGTTTSDLFPSLLTGISEKKFLVFDN